MDSKLVNTQDLKLSWNVPEFKDEDEVFLTPLGKDYLSKAYADELMDYDNVQWDAPFTLDIDELGAYNINLTLEKYITPEDTTPEEDPDPQYETYNMWVDIPEDKVHEYLVNDRYLDYAVESSLKVAWRQVDFHTGDRVKIISTTYHPKLKRFIGSNGSISFINNNIQKPDATEYWVQVDGYKQNIPFSGVDLEMIEQAPAVSSLKLSWKLPMESGARVKLTEAGKAYVKDAYTYYKFTNLDKPFVLFHADVYGGLYIIGDWVANSGNAACTNIRLPQDKLNDFLIKQENSSYNPDGKYKPGFKAGSLTLSAIEDIPSLGMDTVGRPIPNWKGAVVYHSTNAAGLADITKNGYRILGEEAEDGQGGYYGEAISFTPNLEYTKQFGDYTTIGRLSPDIKILNLNDEKDWQTFLKYVGNNTSLQYYPERVMNAGYDGVYDAGAGDLFVYNPKKVKFEGVVDRSKTSAVLFPKTGYWITDQGQELNTGKKEHDMYLRKVIHNYAPDYELAADDEFKESDDDYKFDELYQLRMYVLKDLNWIRIGYMYDTLYVQLGDFTPTKKVYIENFIVSHKLPKGMLVYIDSVTSGKSTQCKVKDIFDNNIRMAAYFGEGYWLLPDGVEIVAHKPHIDVLKDMLATYAPEYKIPEDKSWDDVELQVFEYFIKTKKWIRIRMLPLTIAIHMDVFDDTAKQRIENFLVKHQVRQKQTIIVSEENSDKWYQFYAKDLFDKNIIKASSVNPVDADYWITAKGEDILVDPGYGHIGMLEILDKSFVKDMQQKGLSADDIAEAIFKKYYEQLKWIRIVSTGEFGLNIDTPAWNSDVKKRVEEFIIRHHILINANIFIGPLRFRGTVKDLFDNELPDIKYTKASLKLSWKLTVPSNKGDIVKITPAGMEYLRHRYAPDYLGHFEGRCIIQKISLFDFELNPMGVGEFEVKRKVSIPVAKANDFLEYTNNMTTSLKLSWQNIVDYKNVPFLFTTDLADVCTEGIEDSAKLKLQKDIIMQIVKQAIIESGTPVYIDETVEFYSDTRDPNNGTAFYTVYLTGSENDLVDVIGQLDTMTVSSNDSEITVFSPIDLHELRNHKGEDGKDLYSSLKLGWAQEYKQLTYDVKFTKQGKHFVKNSYPEYEFTNLDNAFILVPDAGYMFTVHGLSGVKDGKLDILSITIPHDKLNKLFYLPATSTTLSSLKLSAIDNAILQQLKDWSEDPAKVPTFDYGGNLYKWLIDANKAGDLRSLDRKSINTMFGQAKNIQQAQSPEAINKSHEQLEREKKQAEIDSKVADFIGRFKDSKSVPAQELLSFVTDETSPLYKYISSFGQTAHKGQIPLRDLNNLYHSLLSTLKMHHTNMYVPPQRHYEAFPYTSYTSDLENTRNAVSGGGTQFGVAIIPNYGALSPRMADLFRFALDNGSAHLKDALAFSRITPLTYYVLSINEKKPIVFKVWAISEMQADDYQKIGGRDSRFVTKMENKFGKGIAEELRQYYRHWPENLMNVIIENAISNNVDQVWMPKGSDVAIKTGQYQQGTREPLDWSRYYDRPAKVFGGELKNVGTELLLDPASTYAKKANMFYVIDLANKKLNSSLNLAYTDTPSTAKVSYKVEDVNENEEKKKIFRSYGAEIEGDNVVLYHGTDAKFAPAELFYNSYLSASPKGKDYTGNAAADTYGKRVHKYVLPIKDVEVASTGEFLYKGNPIQPEPGAKYPDKLYKAYQDYYGASFTRGEMDAESPEQFKMIASMGLTGGNAEFDTLMREHTKKVSWRSWGGNIKVGDKVEVIQAPKYKTVPEHEVGLRGIVQKVEKTNLSLPETHVAVVNLSSGVQRNYYFNELMLLPNDASLYPTASLTLSWKPALYIGDRVQIINTGKFRGQIGVIDHINVDEKNQVAYYAVSIPGDYEMHLYTVHELKVLPKETEASLKLSWAEPHGDYLSEMDPAKIKDNYVCWINPMIPGNYKGIWTVYFSMPGVSTGDVHGDEPSYMDARKFAEKLVRDNNGIYIISSDDKHYREKFLKESSVRFSWSNFNVGDNITITPEGKNYLMHKYYYVVGEKNIGEITEAHVIALRPGSLLIRVKYLPSSSIEPIKIREITALIPTDEAENYVNKVVDKTSTMYDMQPGDSVKVIGGDAIYLGMEGHIEATNEPGQGMPTEYIVVFPSVGNFAKPFTRYELMPVSVESLKLSWNTQADKINIGDTVKVVKTTASFEKYRGKIGHVSMIDQYFYYVSGIVEGDSKQRIPFYVDEIQKVYATEASLKQSWKSLVPGEDIEPGEVFRYNGGADRQWEVFKNIIKGDSIIINSQRNILPILLARVYPAHASTTEQPVNIAISYSELMAYFTKTWPITSSKRLAALADYNWNDIKEKLEMHFNYVLSHNKEDARFADIIKYVNDSDIEQWAWRTFFDEYRIPAQWRGDPEFMAECERIVTEDMHVHLMGAPYIDWLQWIHKAWDDVKWFIQNQREISPDMRVSKEELARDWWGLWQTEQIPEDIKSAPWYNTFKETIVSMLQDKGLGDITSTGYTPPEKSETTIDDLLNINTNKDEQENSEGGEFVDPQGNPAEPGMENFDYNKVLKDLQLPSVDAETVDDLLDQLHQAIQNNDHAKAEEIKEKLRKLQSAVHTLQDKNIHKFSKMQESSLKISWRSLKTGDRVKLIRPKENNIIYKDWQGTITDKYPPKVTGKYVIQLDRKRYKGTLYTEAEEGELKLITPFPDKKSTLRKVDSLEKTAIGVFDGLNAGNGGYPFFYFIQDNNLIIGDFGEAHDKLMEKAIPDETVLNDLLNKHLVYFGRFSERGRAIAFWEPTEAAYANIVKVLECITDLTETWDLHKDIKIIFGGDAKIYTIETLSQITSSLKLSWLTFNLYDKVKIIKHVRPTAVGKTGTITSIARSEHMPDNDYVVKLDGFSGVFIHCLPNELEHLHEATSDLKLSWREIVDMQAVADDFHYNINKKFKLIDSQTALDWGTTVGTIWIVKGFDYSGDTVRLTIRLEHTDATGFHVKFVIYNNFIKWFTPVTESSIKTNSWLTEDQAVDNLKTGKDTKYTITQEGADFYQLPVNGKYWIRNIIHSIYNLDIIVNWKQRGHIYEDVIPYAGFIKYFNSIKDVTASIQTSWQKFIPPALFKGDRVKLFDVPYSAQKSWGDKLDMPGTVLFVGETACKVKFDDGSEVMQVPYKNLQKLPDIVSSIRTSWHILPVFDIGDEVYVVYAKPDYKPIRGIVVDKESGDNGKYLIQSDDPRVRSEAAQEWEFEVKDDPTLDKGDYILQYTLAVSPENLRFVNDVESSLKLSWDMATQEFKMGDTVEIVHLTQGLVSLYTNRLKGKHGKIMGKSEDGFYQVDIPEYTRPIYILPDCLRIVKRYNEASLKLSWAIPGVQPISNGTKFVYKGGAGSVWEQQHYNITEGTVVRVSHQMVAMYQLWVRFMSNGKEVASLLSASELYNYFKLVTPKGTRSSLEVNSWGPQTSYAPGTIVRVIHADPKWDGKTGTIRYMIKNNITNPDMRLYSVRVDDVYAQFYQRELEHVYTKDKELDLFSDASLKLSWLQFAGFEKLKEFYEEHKGGYTDGSDYYGFEFTVKLYANIPDWVREKLGEEQASAVYSDHIEMSYEDDVDYLKGEFPWIEKIYRRGRSGGHLVVVPKNAAEISAMLDEPDTLENPEEQYDIPYAQEVAVSYPFLATMIKEIIAGMEKAYESDEFWKEEIENNFPDEETPEANGEANTAEGSLKLSWNTLRAGDLAYPTHEGRVYLRKEYPGWPWMSQDTINVKDVDSTFLYFNPVVNYEVIDKTYKLPLEKVDLYLIRGKESTAESNLKLGWGGGVTKDTLKVGDRLNLTLENGTLVSADVLDLGTHTFTVEVTATPTETMDKVLIGKLFTIHYADLIEHPGRYHTAHKLAWQALKRGDVVIIKDMPTGPKMQDINGKEGVIAGMNYNHTTYYIILSSTGQSVYLSEKYFTVKPKTASLSLSWKNTAFPFSAGEKVKFTQEGVLYFLNKYPYITTRIPENTIRSMIGNIESTQDVNGVLVSFELPNNKFTMDTFPREKAYLYFTKVQTSSLALSWKQNAEVTPMTPKEALIRLQQELSAENRSTNNMDFDRTETYISVEPLNDTQVQTIMQEHPGILPSEKYRSKLYTDYYIAARKYMGDTLFDFVGANAINKTVEIIEPSFLNSTADINKVMEN